MTRLKRLKIISPCNQTIQETSNPQILECEKCPLAVFNLEAFPAQEAENVFRASKGSRVCAKIRHNQYGELILKDGPVKTFASRIRRTTLQIANLIAQIGLIALVPARGIAQGLETTYGDVRIVSTASYLISYIQGSLGALLLIFSCFSSIGSAIAAYFCKKKRRILIVTCITFVILGVSTFILRDFLGTYFYDGQ